MKPVRIRPYNASRDFEAIRQWVCDERSHAMWCANLIPYPLEKAGFEATLRTAAIRFGDSPFVATTDGGEAIGFFSYSTNLDTNEGMLKFVIVDSRLRGQGYGGEMLKLALKYAFEIMGAETVTLGAFEGNDIAHNCYKKIGFTDRDIRQAEPWNVIEMEIKKADYRG